MGTPRLTSQTLGDLTRDNKLTNIVDLGKQTKAYRDSHRGEKHGGLFSKEAILSILNQPGCVAMRYYFGIDPNPIGKIQNPTIIICGVDSNGDDILTPAGSPLAWERSWSCPPDCSTDNALFQLV